MAAITEREARIRGITNQAIEPGPESLEEKLDELRTFAVARLTSLGFPTVGISSKNTHIATRLSAGLRTTAPGLRRCFTLPLQTCPCLMLSSWMTRAG
jgi:hypothetical protein